MALSPDKLWLNFNLKFPFTANNQNQLEKKMRKLNEQIVKSSTVTKMLSRSGLAVLMPFELDIPAVVGPLEEISIQEVALALRDMTKRKNTGPTGLTLDMI